MNFVFHGIWECRRRLWQNQIEWSTANIIISILGWNVHGRLFDNVKHNRWWYTFYWMIKLMLECWAHKFPCFDTFKFFGLIHFCEHRMETQNIIWKDRFDFGMRRFNDRKKCSWFPRSQASINCSNYRYCGNIS